MIICCKKWNHGTVYLEYSGLKLSGRNGDVGVCFANLYEIDLYRLESGEGEKGIKIIKTGGIILCSNRSQQLQHKTVQYSPSSDWLCFTPCLLTTQCSHVILISVLILTTSSRGAQQAVSLYVFAGFPNFN